MNAFFEDIGWSKQQIWKAQENSIKHTEQKVVGT